MSDQLVAGDRAQAHHEELEIELTAEHFECVLEESKREFGLKGAVAMAWLVTLL